MIVLNKQNFFHFIFFHILAWIFFGVIYYLTLVNHRPGYIYISIFYSFTGSIFSIILSFVFKKLSKSKPLNKIILMSLASIPSATIWVVSNNVFYLCLYPPKISTVPTDWYFSGISIGIFVMMNWVAFYVAFDFNQTANKQKVNYQEAKALANEAQLKMLSYQLNPHFVFNVLNSIAVLILQKKNKLAHETTLKLSSFLRYCLKNNPWKKVSLEKEIMFINKFIEIQKIRFEDQIKVEFDINLPNLETTLVPSLLLQPLIENAIKHTIYKSQSAVKIRVTAEVLNQSDLKMTVWNSIEDSADKLKLNNTQFLEQGIGLSNVRSRLNKYYRDEYIYEYHLKKEYFIVEIIIPLECPNES